MYHLEQLTHRKKYLKKLRMDFIRLADTNEDVVSRLSVMEREIISYCEKQLTQKAFMQFPQPTATELEQTKSFHALPFIAHQLQKKYNDYKLDMMLEHLKNRHLLKIECFKEPFALEFPLFDVGTLATRILKSLATYPSDIYEATRFFKRTLESCSVPNADGKKLDSDQLEIAIKYINSLHQYYAYVKKESLLPIDPEVFDEECQILLRNLIVDYSHPIRARRITVKKFPSFKGSVTSIQLNKAIFSDLLIANKVSSIAFILHDFLKEKKPSYIEEVQHDIEIGIQAMRYLHTFHPISRASAETSGLVPYYAYVAEWLRYDEHIVVKHLLLDQGFERLITLERGKEITGLPSLSTLDHFIHSSPQFFDTILMQIPKDYAGARTLLKCKEQFATIADVFIKAGIIQRPKYGDRTDCPNFDTMIICLQYIAGALHFYAAHDKLNISSQQLTELQGVINNLIYEVEHVDLSNNLVYEIEDMEL